MLKLVEQLVVDAVMLPKPSLLSVDDAAVGEQLHVIGQGGLAAVEVFQDLVRAHILLAQHPEDLHPVVVAECLTDIDVGLFFHSVILPSLIPTVILIYR